MTINKTKDPGVIIRNPMHKHHKVEHQPPFQGMPLSEKCICSTSFVIRGVGPI